MIAAAAAGEAIALGVAATAAVAATLSAGISAWQGLLIKRSERNRTEPLVVVYECGEPERVAGHVQLGVMITNEGVGPALNVRFGIRLHGERLPYRPRPASGQGPGDVPRAIGPGRTLPEHNRAYLLLVPVTELSEGGTVPEERAYWCVYENSFGDTWETVNAWRPDINLEIRSVRTAGVAG